MMITSHVLSALLAWAPPAGDSVEAPADHTAAEKPAAKPAKGRFDAGYLFIGAQAMGNLTILGPDSTKPLPGAGGSLLIEYVIIPYLKIGLEPGYAWAGYKNTLVTDKAANIVDNSLNLYVDPADKIQKRGGRGTIRDHAFILPLVLKARYPIAFGKKAMFVAPFLSVGGQVQFNLASSYAVQQDDTFDYRAHLNKVDFKLLGGLGLDISLGKAGQIGIEGRLLFGATRTPQQQVILNSRPNQSTTSQFPIDFTVPQNRWNQVQLLLNYRYGFALGRT